MTKHDNCDTTIPSNMTSVRPACHKSPSNRTAIAYHCLKKPTISWYTTIEILSVFFKIVLITKSAILIILKGINLSPQTNKSSNKSSIGKIISWFAIPSLQALDLRSWRLFLWSWRSLKNILASPVMSLRCAFISAKQSATEKLDRPSIALSRFALFRVLINF